MINRKRILLFLVLILIIVIAGTVIYSTFFRVVSVDPNGKNIPTSLGVIKVKFSKKINVVSRDQVVSPNGGFTIKDVSVKDNYLYIDIEPLTDGSVGSLTIKEVTSVNGQKKILDLNYTFIGKYIPYNKLTKDQKQELISRTDPGEAERNSKYPLLTKLPITNDAYTVSFFGYDANQKPQISIVINYSNADYKDPNFSQLAVTRNQDAINEITKLGYNKETYVIVHPEQPELN